MFDFKKVPDGLTDRRSMVIKKKPNITIITPFYNAGKTLMQTVNSVLSQTYPYFEWIIIDDGSKDKASLKELEKVSNLDDRITVFHKENAGPSQARDFGIERSSRSSKYIYFLDADDIIDKTMIECLYFSLESHKDASFAYTAMANFGDREFIWDKYLTIEQEKKENLICISSMVRKRDLLEVGCFGIKEKSMYEDWNLWLKLIAAGKKPLRINVPLFWYRTSNSGELSRAMDNHEAAMKYVNETAAKIKNNVEIIQFPRVGDSNRNRFDWKSTVYPQYKKDGKKTILFLIPWMVVGGADLFNLDILKRIDKNKFNSIVITMLPSDNPLRQEFEEYSSAVYDISSFIDRVDYPSFVNYIIKSRNVDSIFLSNCSYAYAMLPIIKKEFPKVSVIDYVHSIDPKAKKGGFGGFSKDFDTFIDITYTCNDFTTNQLKNDFGKTKVETMYIGTDHKRFNPKKYNKNELKKKYNIPNDKLVISYVARFSEEKRPLLFIEIAKEFLKERNDVIFVMAGSGDFEKKVKDKIAKYGLKNKIMLPGSTNTPEEIYSISDITVNCSRLEGLALTSYESLSMGVPVVSADVGGQKELIDDTVGKIITYNPKLKEKVEVMNYIEGLNYSVNNLNKLKSNARKKITEEFNLDKTVEKLEKIIMDTKAKKFEGIYCNDLVYDLYLDLLFDEYMWFCHKFTTENYGISMYDFTNLYEDAFSFKQKFKRKLINICNRFNIKNESITILNFIRNIIAFVRSFVYIFIFGFKSIVSMISIFIKLAKKVYQKQTEFINYLIVGVMTTIVSLLIYYVCVLTILDPSNALQLQVANMISWVGAVLFAYVANRQIVFKSKNKSAFKEAMSFVGARITTLIIDMFMMFLMVTTLGINDKISKLIVQVIIVILNFVLSKLFVFSKRK